LSPPSLLPIQWIIGILSTHVKWLKCEADHELVASAEVNAWTCNFILFKMFSHTSFLIPWKIKRVLQYNKYDVGIIINGTENDLKKNNHGLKGIRKRMKNEC
jgi:hypothetical protein